MSLAVVLRLEQDGVLGVIATMGDVDVCGELDAPSVMSNLEDRKVLEKRSTSSVSFF